MNSFDDTLCEAAYGGNKEIVDLMLKHGATDYNGALISAIRGGHIEIAKMMFELGANNFEEAVETATLTSSK